VIREVFTQRRWGPLIEKDAHRVQAITRLFSANASTASA
jgi:hypothetical protein